ncbi:MAG TPA: hypothetical protein VIW23_13770 [Candidatus Acidoferrum sp.]|jgi:hypothetical protein
MYSKKAVCFTAVLTLAASCYLGAQRIATLRSAGDSVRTVADGTHPPPVPPSPQPPSLQPGDVLQADGTHPPPVPWFWTASQGS